MSRLQTGSSLLLALLLAACGGSSSSSSPGQTPGSGSTALAISGTITAKAAGSMTVNGVTLDTSAATVRIEKQQRPETELHHGMVVRVRGSRDGGGAAKATEVEFEDHVQGRSAADVLPGAQTITVGGREVQIEDSTRVMDDHGIDLAPEVLKQDDRLRVSGFADDQGRLHATSVQRMATASADDSFEAKGFVVAIAAGRASFDLSLTPGGAVAWHVTMASGTLAAEVLVGSFVEVHSASAAVGIDVTATLVTLDDHGLGDAGAEAEVEGIVTSGDSASFEVDGQVVITSSATRWENGVAGDLLPGVKVEAEGHIDGSGNLIAEKVSFRDSARLQGLVSGGPGSFTILGFPLSLTGSVDGASLLVAGDVVQVRGYPKSSGSGMVVTRVQAVSGGNPKSFVQGPVTAANAAAGSVQMLGATIVAATGASFSDHEQMALSKADFFARLVVGRSVVKARVASAPSGVPPTASSDELELEDEPASHM